MANQISLQLLVPPGEELLCDADAHIVTYEIGAAAAIGGISTRTWPPVGADIDPGVVASMVRPAGFHAVATRAIAVEQTHNRGGGGVIRLDTLRALRGVADDAGIALHCDGARIWHAHVAAGVPLREYGALFDTLSVCLSKGLGAPVGSLVVSSAGSASKRPGCCASGWAAACARSACSPRPAATRWTTTWRASPTTTRGPVASPRRSPPPALSTPGGWSRTSCCWTWPRRRWTGRRSPPRPRAEGILVSVTGPRSARLLTHLDVDDAAVTRAADVLPALLS